MDARGRDYFEGIQGLRFVAGFMVLVCHAFFYTSERLGTAPVAWHEGSRGADIFFVISGFVMVVASRKLLGRPDGWRIFAVRRLLRVVPLYWIATTLSVLALVLASRLVLHDHLDWPLILKSYLFIPALNTDGKVVPVHAVGWTLTFEMFFYAIFAVGLFCRRNVIVVASAIILPLAFVSMFKTPEDKLSLFYADPIMLEFLAGMFVAKMIGRGQRLPFAPEIGIAALLFLCLIPGDGHWIPLIPSTLLIYAAASFEWRMPRWLLFQGQASYSLYLFHPLCAPLAPVVLRELGIESVSVSVALAVATGLLAGSVGHLLIERTITEGIPRLWREVSERRKRAWRTCASSQRPKGSRSWNSFASRCIRLKRSPSSVGMVATAVLGWEAM